MAEAATPSASAVADRDVRWGERDNSEEADDVGCKSKEEEGADARGGAASIGLVRCLTTPHSLAPVVRSHACEWVCMGVCVRERESGEVRTDVPTRAGWGVWKDVEYVTHVSAVALDVCWEANQVQVRVHTSRRICSLGTR